MTRTVSPCCRAAAVAAALALGGGACEPAGPALLVVDGVPCADGTLPATFTGLRPNVPLDHAFRVTDDRDGTPVLSAAFADGSDPGLTLLRAPFVADGAVVVPFRAVAPGPEPVSGALALSPDAGNGLPPCTIAISASAP